MNFVPHLPNDHSLADPPLARGPVASHTVSSHPFLGKPATFSGKPATQGPEAAGRRGDDRQGGHQRAEGLIRLGHFDKRGSVGYETGKQEVRHKKLRALQASR